MPLIKSKSNKARLENIGAEINAGKDPKVAEAIAYDIQRKATARHPPKKKKKAK